MIFRLFAVVLLLSSLTLAPAQDTAQNPEKHNVELILDAPGEVAAGASFEVGWSGPGNRGDYITIVPAGALVGGYMDYAYTTEGNPVTLTAPEEAGSYEVRYSTEQASPNPTLASTPITVR